MPVLRELPYGAFNFLVSFEGTDVEGAAAGFSEITGLNQSVELLQYRAGNDRTSAPRVIAGLSRPVTVTMTRGVIGDTSLQEWLNTVIGGSVERRTVVIHLRSEDRSETVQTWKLRSAIPIALEGPTLDAMQSTIAVERLVLVAESLTVE